MNVNHMNCGFGPWAQAGMIRILLIRELEFIGDCD